MTERDWDSLVRGLYRRDCILLLGDEATGPAGRTLREQLTQQLQADLRDERAAELDFPQVAWLYESKESRSDLQNRVISFFESQPDTPFTVHTLLAKLPFHCIVTSGHDSSMQRALEGAGKTPRVAAYHYRSTADVLENAGTPKQPLLFHLLGRPSAWGSLVLTEQDLVDFLKAIAAQVPPIPHALLTELRNRDKMFLFLGFGVRNWYTRLLLHVLKEQSGNSRSFALEEFPPPSDLRRNVFFYRHGYKVEVFDRSVTSFVEELCTRYERKYPGAAVPPDPAPAGTGRQPTAFICHVHDNAALAERVHHGLVEDGVDAWLDKANLEPGAEWNDEIKDKISDADYFVVLITPELAQRDKSFALSEIKMAKQTAQMYRSSRRFIIPVRTENAPLLDELEELHQEFVISTSSERADITKLASSIKRDHQLRLKKGA